MKKLPVKVFHLRALPACLASLVTGILLVSIDVWWISLVCFGLVAAALVVGTVLAPRRKALGIACIACLALSLVTVAWASALGTAVKPVVGEVLEDGSISEVAIEGRICEVRTDGDGTVRALVLDRLSMDGRAYEGKMLVTPPEGIWVFAEDVEGLVVGRVFSMGDYVRAKGEVQNNVLWYYDSYSVHSALGRLFYSTYATELEKTDTPARLTAVEKVQLGLYRVLRRNMGATAGFAFAFLTGKTCYVSPLVLGDFRSTGTAHLLAVSGLHVGVLAGVLAWLLKKCRCPARVRPAVYLAVLGVYAWLCSATPSVLRASILVVVASFAQSVGRRRDPPSILALTALALLVVQPLYLFDVSFLLSFSAYTGIVLLYQPLRNLLRRVPGKAGDSLSLGLSVSASITPVSTYFFGGTSLLTLPLNLLLIPVMSVVYVVLFAGALLAIIPHMGFVLIALSYLLRGLFAVEAYLGGVAYVATATAVWMLPLFYGGTALFGEYCLMPKRVKYPVAAALCLVTTVLAFAL